MRTNFVIGFLISVFVFPLAYISEANAQPTSGDQEVQAAASVFRPLGQRGGNFNADLSYGFYLDNPAWQVGIRQGYNHIYSRDRSDVWTGTTVPFLNYHFMGMDRFVPFLGGFVGAVYNDRDITGTVGPQLGVKAFMGTNTFVNIQYRYEWFFDNLRTRDIRDTSGANHIGNVGLGYVWGGSRR